MYFPFLFFYFGTVEFIRFDTDYSPDYYTERCFLLFCFLSNFFHLYRKPIFSFWLSLIRNDSIISVTAIQYGWIYTIYIYSSPFIFPCNLKYSKVRFFVFHLSLWMKAEEYLILNYVIMIWISSFSLLHYSNSNFFFLFIYFLFLSFLYFRFFLKAGLAYIL